MGTKNLNIECKGISEINSRSYCMEVELQDVDMSFLEDLSSKDIVLNHNNEDLLREMDIDEVIEFITNSGYRVGE